MAVNIDQIKVRMYRQGFGDCFLLRFFKGDEISYTMLIDCGLKKNDKVDTASMDDVVADIKKILSKPKQNPHLHTLVVTHEHWDHVSEFHPTKTFFENFDIDRIWMAWTEDPTDDVAKQINAHLRKGAKVIGLASDQIKKTKPATEAALQFEYAFEALAKAREEFSVSLSDVAGFAGPIDLTLAKNEIVTPSGITIKKNFDISLGTEQAMDHIKSISGPGIKYYEPGQIILDKNDLPGIRIYVLGPPKNMLINKDLPTTGEGKETYLTSDQSSLNGFMDGIMCMSMAPENTEDDGRPFPDCDSIPNSNAQILPMYSGNYYDPEQAWRTIEDDWMEIAGSLALQMDNDTNNTSLALAIEIIDSGKVLLFPADAQVGSWLSWKDLHFKVEKNNGISEVNIKDIFERTVLYKVSHHCSHNATLKNDGLELMTSDELVALIPEKKDQYKGIPHPPLVERIRQKTKGRILFSADTNFPVEDIQHTKPINLSKSEWEAFTANLTITPLYLEYNVHA